jgi:hypothetical protein
MLPDGAPLYWKRLYKSAAVDPVTGKPRKEFLAFHLKDGQQIVGAGPRRVIYNWPAILHAGPGSTVFCVEGESNADALSQHGLLATTTAFHDWPMECVDALRGRHLIVVEDHDELGRSIAAKTQDKLTPVAESLRRVPALHLWKNLGRPGEPPLSWDVKNWLEDGGDPARLLDICRTIPTDGPKLVYLDMSRWDFEPTPEQEWAVYNRIPLRQTVLFSGEGATGKSTEQLHLSAATVLERDWLGVAPEQGPAIFIDAEDDDKVLHRRLKAIAEHYNVNITEMIQRNLRLVSWLGCDATLAISSKKSGKIEPTPLYK